MPMTGAMQRAAAKKFAAEWKGKGYERGDSQPFWLSLLRDVFGIEAPEQFIIFEEQVRLDRATSFIDAEIPATHVLIEQKGADKDLKKPIRQSDGALLTPFQQAKRYAAELPYSKRPRWIVTCNFAEFHIYDMERPRGEAVIVRLEDLPSEYYRLQFLVDEASESIAKEMQVSLQAGELVGRLYDALLMQYKDPESPDALRSLNVLCVRLVFCLYADDSGVFGRRGMFHDYLASCAAKDARRALLDLFAALDTLPEERDPYMEETLAAFPYVNGGLFADERIEIPRLSGAIMELLLRRAGEPFDWSGISPTIFGAVFESTLNPETRRHGGMHYTSIENIHKAIDPLFLDSLREDLEEIKALPAPRAKRQRLQDFQDKLSRLTFLDPACGSGNFLTETYLSLRRLENEALAILQNGQIAFGGLEGASPIKVSIGQFYGIEINDFAATVARTALWIAESQMMRETEEIVQMDLDFLPLKTDAHIHEGNALRMDWESVAPGKSLSYIIGNPPFVGARLMSAGQKSDLLSVFGKEWKGAGNLDYVSCWYKKAASLMQGAATRCALVSTNSVSQGDAVATLWKPLLEEGAHIDFAHRAFRWDSESSQKAHVHCVIIGFSRAPNEGPKRIFDGQQEKIVKHINAYLLEGRDVFVESRSRPLCDVPEIGIGNKPIDGGNYLFTRDEMEAFVKKEPESRAYFRPWYGSWEFINQKPRYCLYLGDCPPQVLRKMPECMKRVQAVRELRLASKSEGTRKLAERPARFHVENMPGKDYLLIPRVSSEKRAYVPMGFVGPGALASDSVHIIPDATLYHFGVLTSNVHMAWMRCVAGRLEMRYRYSKDIVYNNFPWPKPTLEQKERIERCAWAILDARARCPEASLADLYDELAMPADLRRAHQENDKTVMSAYGWEWRGMTESECVAALMELYAKLSAQDRGLG